MIFILLKKYWYKPVVYYSGKTIYDQTQFNHREDGYHSLVATVACQCHKQSLNNKH